MFLITTADIRCLPTDNQDDLLFLGEWCNIFGQSEKKFTFPPHIMPYPWSNNECKKSDFKEIQNLYSSMLIYLKDYLNNIHNLDEDEGYWELIIGAWLQLTVAIIVERYRCLIEATTKNSISDTMVFNSDMNIEPVLNYSSFSEKYIDDEWNLYIYSKIIHYTEMCPYTCIADNHATDTTSSNVEAIKKIKYVHVVKKVAGKFFVLIAANYNKIYFSNSYFSRSKLLRLQLRLRQIPFLVSPLIDVKDNATNWDVRKEIPVAEGNECLNILAKLIPLLLPKSYVESFQDLKNSSAKLYPKTVKLINTGTSDISDDGFKVWAASQRKKGVPLLINQHGGCYGVSELTQAEIFQTKVASKFYSWGWGGNDKVVPMPATKLVELSVDKYDPEGQILLIQFNHSRYSYWAQSFPIAEQMKEYFDEQILFLNNLSQQSFRHLRIRYYPKDFGWEVERRFSDVGFSGLKENSATLNDAIGKSRLCIATYNATTFLETLSSDIPTVIFWNDNHFPLRSSAIKWYEKLKVAGILHDDAISAAKKVNEICDQPLMWWKEAGVQRAKNEFCNHYAKKSDDWLDVWADELNSMIATEND